MYLNATCTNVALLSNLELTIWLRLLFGKIFWTRGSLTPSYRVASRCFSFLDPMPLQWRNSLSITLSNCDVFKTSYLGSTVLSSH